MIKKPITINLSTGLEARPVAQLVQVASQFNSEIYVEIGKKRVNAKSIMGMMTLGLDAGEEITLSANGEDEEAAMAGIEQIVFRIEHIRKGRPLFGCVLSCIRQQCYCEQSEQ